MVNYHRKKIWLISAEEIHGNERLARRRILVGEEGDALGPGIQNISNVNF